MMKRSHRRWLATGTVTLAFALAITSLALAGPIGTASGFEDDDGNLAVNATFDWNGFTGTWTGTAPSRQASETTSGWQFTGLEDRQVSTADSAFAGGTKQDNNCPTVIGAKAPNKDDLKRVYLSTKTVNGNVYLNLAWVRITQNTTSPSAHIGFEFNQGSTPCATGGLVSRTAGDMLIVYDFEGGSGDTPTLTLRRWRTTGSPCEVASNSAPCWGPAVNLTAGGFAEAKVNTTATALDTVGPTNETLGLNEFGEAGINLTAAQVFPAGQCATFGKAYAVSRSSGNSAQAQMKDLVGPANFNLANCATVIIRKVTSPAGDTTTSFGYTTNVTTSPATTTSPFSLKDGESNTIANVVTGAGKTVTEANPGPAYALTNINCSASTVPAANRSTDTATRTVTFSIAAGEVLDCTFTNTKQLGALKILKQSTKTGNPLVTQAGAVFSYDSSSVTDNGAGDLDADIGEVCVSGLATGAYSVSETSPPPGYGAATGGSQSVTVVAGTNCTDNQPAAGATATFRNDPLADLLVRVDGQESGEIRSSIDCTVGADIGIPDPVDPAVLDVDDLAPQTITCTIVIDP